MTLLCDTSSRVETVADLLARLGGISGDRVRLSPPPGQATEQDVIELEAHGDRLCELVDGVLVEKPVGYEESIIAGAVLTALNNFLSESHLGWVSGSDGMMRLAGRQVRMPDVAFVSRERSPQLPRGPIANVAPDLAVEMLSLSNTSAEMLRKRQEYFGSGTRLVWEFDLETRTVAIYSQADAPPQVRSAAETLTGDAVLPGFELPLSRLFSLLDD